jgi:hypothetical protein
MKKVSVWVAYAPPVDEVDHPEPSLRVVAPADWGRERAEKALRDMGYKVAFLLELPVALRNGIVESRFCGVPIGERLMRAWDYLPSNIVVLPSGRVITPRRVSRGYSRRVLSVPAYPRSITSAYFYADGGWHVFTILATEIPDNLFGEGSYKEALMVLLEDFLPRGWDYTPIKRGFEVELEGLTKPQAHAVCRLLRELTHKLLRGMLSYRLGRSRRPLPQEYLRFLTQEEFQVLQPLLGLD